MNAGERELRIGPRLGRFRTVNGQAGDLRQSQKGIGRKVGVVRVDGREADFVDKVDRRAKGDGLGNGNRARLELGRQTGPRRAVPENFADHVAAAEERVHCFQERAATVKYANSSRAVQLVPGESQKVDAQLADVCRKVGDALAPSTRTYTAPCFFARSTISAIGGTVPRTLDMPVMATIRVRPEEPVQLIQVDQTVRPQVDKLQPGLFSRATCCQGTRLA